jgi:hypothetical protein
MIRVEPKQVKPETEARRQNPKSEARNPKEIPSPKFQRREQNSLAWDLGFASDFGFKSTGRFQI